MRSNPASIFKEILIFTTGRITPRRHKIKPNRKLKPVNYFLDNFNFSLTTCTQKKGSVATLGTLGKEKLKLAKKN